MKHRKRTLKLGRTSSHRRCLFSNMLKALVTHGRITTTTAKGKELKRQADKLITLAKKDTLASKRAIIAQLMIRYNQLSTKQIRAARTGEDTSAYNDDRNLLNKLHEIQSSFKERNGGYTRLVHADRRHGDQAPMCIVEFVS